jgi:hypothetical protein
MRFSHRRLRLDPGRLLMLLMIEEETETSGDDKSYKGAHALQRQQLASQSGWLGAVRAIRAQVRAGAAMPPIAAGVS